MYSTSDKNSSASSFTLLDGPLNAYGDITVFHAYGRVLKDVALRSHRKAGFNSYSKCAFETQGEWAEREIRMTEPVYMGRPHYEIDNSNEIFTAACVSQIEQAKTHLIEQSKQLRQEMDWTPFETCSKENVENVWRFISECNSRGLLKTRERTLRWCPNCRTAVSNNDAESGHLTHKHTCTVSFPVDDDNAALLVYCGAAWTLPANVALAVNPEAEYVRAVFHDKENREFICSKGALSSLSENATVTDSFTGNELVGKVYTSCANGLRDDNLTRKIVALKTVNPDEGTGVVHLAPGCGLNDYQQCKNLDLPLVSPLDEYGLFTEEYGALSGCSCEQADSAVIEYLKEQELFFREHISEGMSSECAYCGTELTYRTVEEWVINVDGFRDNLLRLSETVKWTSAVCHNDFVKWVSGMDSEWSISRDRHYGIPLPIYKCDKCGKVHIASSLEELAGAGLDITAKDFMPFPAMIDDTALPCECSGEMHRVRGTCDCWMGSGMMPVTLQKSSAAPADVVIEHKKQASLWFYYTLLISMVMNGTAPYKTVVSHCDIVDSSTNTVYMKNAIPAAEFIGRHSSDAVRYAMLKGNMEKNVNFNDETCNQAQASLERVRNLFAFYETYFADCGKTKIENVRNALDLWLISRAELLAKRVYDDYSEYRFDKVLEEGEAFVEEVYLYYINYRKSAYGRLNKSEKKGCAAALCYALTLLCLCIEPVVPDTAEELWKKLADDFGTPQESLRDSVLPELERAEDAILEQKKQVEEIIRVVKMLRAKEFGPQYPLKALKVYAEPACVAALLNFKELVKAETNVKNIQLTNDPEELYDFNITVNLRAVGSILGARTAELRNTLQQLTAEEKKALVSSFMEDEDVCIDGFPVLPNEYFSVQRTLKHGCAHIMENGCDLLLIDPETNSDFDFEEKVRKEIRGIIQECRCDAKMEVSEDALVSIQCEDQRVMQIAEEMRSAMANNILVPAVDNAVHFFTKQLNSSSDTVVNVTLRAVTPLV